MADTDEGKAAAVESQIAEQHQTIDIINAAMINHSCLIADEIGAHAVLAYIDVVKSSKNLEAFLQERRCLLAAGNESVIQELQSMQGIEDRIIRVPKINLTRTSQVKVAAMLALSQGLIKRGDRIVCLSGSTGYGVFDNLTVMDLGREFELLSSVDMDIVSQVAKPHVFERLLTLVMELAEEGKEGKPLGTIFILGDYEKVMQMSDQMIINPFRWVPENERNILDLELKETIREFSTIDGAFIVRDDGTVLAAGRHLKVSAEDTHLPQGLGARHRAAAGITAVTDAIAFVISESTGYIRIFSRGRVFMEIEKTGPRGR